MIATVFHLVVFLMHGPGRALSCNHKLIAETKEKAMSEKGSVISYRYSWLPYSSTARERVPFLSLLW